MLLQFLLIRPIILESQQTEDCDIAQGENKHHDRECTAYGIDLIDDK